MPVPLTYCLRNVWVRRRTSAATAIGIGLVVFVLATSRMLALGLRSTLLAAGRDTRAIVMQHDAFSESSSRVRQSVLSLVASAPGVKKSPAGEPSVVGETVSIINLPHAHDAQRFASVQVRGVAPASFELRPEVRISEGRPLQSGSDEAIVGRGIVGRYAGLRLNDAIELKSGRPIRIVGIFEAKDSAYESELWVDLEAVRTSTQFQGFLSSATAELESASDLDVFAATLESDPRQGLTVEREKTYYARVSDNLAAVITGLGGMVTLIFSLGAMLGAMITMHGSVGKRRREIGVLRALGFSRVHILLAVLLEALALALIGGLFGVALSLVMPWVGFSAKNAATGQEIVFGFSADAVILLGALMVGALVGVFGGFLPALKAARVHPIAAMRA